ncbi:hypothetical protein ACF0H5_022239 [Mactra antiquata]
MGEIKYPDDIPRVNLAQFHLDNMDRFGDLVALVDANTNKQYTYCEVKDRIQRLAAGYKNLGLREGDVLCALTYNTIEYPIIWFAANLLGATFQTASPLYTDEELERRFCECSAKFLVTIPELLPRIKTININIKKRNMSNKNILNKIIVIGTSDEFISYDSLYSNERVTKPADIDPMNTASILLSSSGTTGLPKFVRLSHVNFASNVIHIKRTIPIKTGDCTILALPVFHHFGAFGALCSLMYVGLKLVVMEKFDVPQYLNLIQAYKANFLQMVPTMGARLVKYPQRHKYDISSVKYIMTAAAPLGIELEKQLREMFKLPFIGQGYGLTETGYNCGNTVDRYRSGSSGVVPKGVIIKVVDPDTGKVVPNNTRGEILVGGPQITIGYLNNPKANKESFDENGFFKTGDVGYFDDDGFIYIVDRIKELIKYKGLQVAPAILEDILVKHEAIADAAVIGIPDPDAGELPKAFVVVLPGHNVTPQEIVKYVEGHVSSYMRLRGGVEFIDQIPRNPSGKILRRFLRDRTKKSKL